MRRVGLVAALPGELAPLVRGWESRGDVFLGDFGEDQVRVFAASAGMGAAAATRALARVTAAAEQEGGTLEAVVSYGWAGAITCAVKPPQVHTVAEVIDSCTGERFQTAGAAAGNAQVRLVTLDHVARPAEKRALAERYGAVLVDMEAAAVARLARARSIEFFCIKGISDGYTDALPDFNLFLDAHGQLRMPALIAQAVLHPGWWPSLWRLGAQSRLAARNLAIALPSCLGQPRLVS